MITSIFNDVTSTIELTSILLYSLCSIVLGIFLALTHKKTSKCNKNFLVTLSLLPFLVATVMIMVNGNLGTSVAILGAFSLVRFRSLPGTSKEILSIFFAMAIGLATGMGHLIFAILIALIGCVVLLILDKITLLDNNVQEKVLKIVLPEDLDYEEVFIDTFTKYTKHYELEQVKTINMGSLFELRYRIILKKNISEKEFIDELRIQNGNLKIILSKPIEESEL